MSGNKDFLNMIEILGYALEIQGRVEESFRRSARNATSVVARDLFSEIAEDFGQYRERLQMRKQKLLEALSHLRLAEHNSEERSHELAAVSAFETPRVEHNTHQTGGIQVTARDPVCDMTVNEEGCKYVSVHRGKKYFFCCDDCQKAFKLSPRKYIRD